MPFLDHFGILAPFYDRVIQPKNPEVLWRLAELPTSGLLLDAGGGTGRVANYMQSKASRVVIADLSHKMLVQAREKGGFDLACSHTESLPFADERFDRILMVDALHHVCDQRGTILELWRVLKRGGVLVIEEPDIRNFSVKILALAEKVMLMRSHFLHPNKIAALFSDPNAKIRIENDSFNAWVIVKKN